MSHISTLDLHRLRYGELDKEQTRALRQHIDGCEQCLARMQAQSSMRAEFEVLPVPAAIRDAAKEPVRQRSRWWAWAPGVAVAAVALVAIAPMIVDQGEQDGIGIDEPVDDIRYKSAGGIEILVEGQGLVDPTKTTLSPGDRIQVRVPPGPWKHAWVTDGDKILGTFELEAGRATLAPFSLELDAHGDKDTIEVIVAYEPLRDNQLDQVLEGRRMPGVEVSSVTLRKSTAR